MHPQFDVTVDKHKQIIGINDGELKQKKFSYTILWELQVKIMICKESLKFVTLNIFLANCLFQLWYKLLRHVLLFIIWDVLQVCDRCEVFYAQNFAAILL